jgi:hypothetical protein
MKKILLIISLFIVCCNALIAQNKVPKLPSIATQQAAALARPGTAFAALIAANQNFSILNPEELTDNRRLPLWLRVYWRKNHPNGNYDVNNPTGGYPHVLKEILEWMQAHQDLKPGPGTVPTEKPQKPIATNVPDAVVTNEVRISGLQTAPRSETDIRINYFDPTKILAGSNNIGGSGRQGIYYSTNGGTSWAQTELPLETADAFQSDPTAEWTSDGKAWSSTLGINSGQTVLKMRNYVSVNNGATWTLDGTPSGAQTDVDKQMVWVDHSPTSPYKDQQYAIWHNNDPAYMNRRTPGVAGTWLPTPIQVSGAESIGTAIGSDVKTNSYGDVFGFWPTTTNRKIFVTKSTNGGASYSTPVQIATTFGGYDIGVPSFNGRRALIYVSGGAYRTASKNLVYACWTDFSGDGGCTSDANEPGSNVAATCKTRIWFCRSTDGGLTWGTPIKINNQAGLNDQFNPWLAVDETNGNIGIMYYDTEADAGRKKTNVYYQFSANDGATWYSPTKITTASTDETVAGANSGNQYGDYNGLSAYADVIMPVWTDRRNNALEEVWTAKTSNTLLPLVVAAGATAVTASNCGITAFEPNETVTVNFGLKNIGELATTSITATLLASGGITVINGTQNYGILPAASSVVTRPFTFTFNGTCGSTATATLLVASGSYSTIVTYTFVLGGTTTTTIFSENFESAIAPALPTNWTAAQTGTTPPPLFATTTTGPSSGLNAVFTNGVATAASNSLTSPVINVPTTGIKTLSFSHAYNFEKNNSSAALYDGGLVELSTDGGANFISIAAAGGSFTSNGYTGSISTGYDNPIAGLMAWSGAQPSYITSIINLPANFGGSNVKIRWRAGWDNSTAVLNPNWRIDNIQLQLITPICATCAEINVLADNPGTIAIPDGSTTNTTTNFTSFGAIPVLSTATRSYIIKNIGASATPLTINNITKNGATAADFTISGITLPTTLAAGASDTFLITYQPTTLGSSSAVININNTDGDEADYDFNIMGTANCPQLGADTTVLLNCLGNTTNLLPLYTATGFAANWNTATPTAAPAGTYELTISNASLPSCTDVAVAIVKLEVATWTGITSDNWHTASNWSTLKVPTALTHVIIPTGAANNCKISSPNAEAASIQIRNGATIQAVGSNMLQVKGKCITLPTL